MTTATCSVIVDRTFLVEDAARAAANRHALEQENKHKPRRSWNIEPVAERMPERKYNNNFTQAFSKLPPTSEINEEDTMSGTGQIKSNLEKSKLYKQMAPQLIAECRELGFGEAMDKHNIPKGTRKKLINYWERDKLINAGEFSPGKGHYRKKVVRPAAVKPAVKTAGDINDTITVKTRWAKIEETPETNPLLPADVDPRSFAIGYRLAVIDILGVK